MNLFLLSIHYHTLCVTNAHTDFTFTYDILQFFTFTVYIVTSNYIKKRTAFVQISVLFFSLIKKNKHSVWSFTIALQKRNIERVIFSRFFCYSEERKNGTTQKKNLIILLNAFYAFCY